MSTDYIVPNEHEDVRSTKYSVKKETTDCMYDVSNWTVINDVPSTPLPRTSQWPNEKDSTGLGLHLVKQDPDVKTTFRNTPTADTWLHINIKTETDDCKMRDLSTLMNLKNKSCGDTIIGDIHQANGKGFTWPVPCVKPEKPDLVIKEEPQSDSSMDMQDGDAAGETFSQDEMIVFVVKEEIDESFASNAGCVDVVTKNDNNANQNIQPSPKPNKLKDMASEKHCHTGKNSVSKCMKSSDKQNTCRYKKCISQVKVDLNDRSRRIRCWLCKQLLSNKITLNEHLKDCKSVQEQVCETTDRSASQCVKCTGKRPMEKHDCDKKPTVLTYHCSKCDREFVSKGNFVQHKEWHLRQGHEDINMHIKGLPVESSACGKVKKIEKGDSKTQTQKRKVKAENILVSCPVCNKKLRKQSFARHMKVHSTDPKDHPFKCPKCDKRYIEKRDLLMHYSRNHGQDQFCSIKAHKKYPCSKCGKVYTCKTNLKLHIEGVHLKSYKCSKCDSTFYNDFNLQRHIRSCQKNSEASPDNHSFTCNNCKVSFRTKYTLTKHIARFHSDETPFECQFCLKQFKARSNLTAHVKRLHSTGKAMSVQCAKCSRCFSSQAELDIHCSVFRFVCQSCPQHFWRANQLKDHAKQHHRCEI